MTRAPIYIDPELLAYVESFAQRELNGDGFSEPALSDFFTVG
jgi:hypothetical protein